MSTPTDKRAELLRWGPRLARRFDKAPPRDDDLVGATLAEALRPPKPADALAWRVPDAETTAARRESEVWLGRMVRAAHQPPGLDSGVEWLGLRGYAHGQDVLVTGWTSPLRSLQVVATRERIHLCTSLAPEVVADDEARVSAAAALAEQLFEAWFPTEPVQWSIARTGSWTYAVRAEEPARNWSGTCLIVSDGMGVKLSFLKLLMPDHVTKGQRAGPDVRPWFDKPTRDEEAGG